MGKAKERTKNPLACGCDADTISENIRAEMHAGKPHQQAIAIALSHHKRQGCPYPVPKTEAGRRPMPRKDNPLSADDRAFLQAIKEEFAKRTGGMEPELFGIAHQDDAFAKPTGLWEGWVLSSRFPGNGEMALTWSWDAKTRQLTLIVVSWQWDEVPAKYKARAKTMLDETRLIGEYSDTDGGLTLIGQENPEVFFNVVIEPLLGDFGLTAKSKRKKNPFVAEADGESARGEHYGDVVPWAHKQVAEGRTARVYAEGPHGKQLVSELAPKESQIALKADAPHDRIPKMGDWRSLETWLREHGWRIERTAKNHFKMFSPHGGCIVTASGSPSDHRFLAKVVSDLRRCERQDVGAGARAGNPAPLVKHGRGFQATLEMGPLEPRIIIEKKAQDGVLFHAVAGFREGMGDYARRRFDDLKTDLDAVDLLREFGSESDAQNFEILVVRGGR